jgi:hypothetical protein
LGFHALLLLLLYTNISAGDDVNVYCACCVLAGAAEGAPAAAPHVARSPHPTSSSAQPPQRASIPKIICRSSSSDSDSSSSSSSEEAGPFTVDANAPGMLLHFGRGGAESAAAGTVVRHNNSSSSSRGNVPQQQQQHAEVHSLWQNASVAAITPALTATELRGTPAAAAAAVHGGLQPGLEVAAAAAAGPAGADVFELEGDESLCVVCWERPCTVGLLHGEDVHLCMCGVCFAAYDVSNGCPMCRRPVEDSVDLA